LEISDRVKIFNQWVRFKRHRTLLKGKIMRKSIGAIIACCLLGGCAKEALISRPSAGLPSAAIAKHLHVLGTGVGHEFSLSPVGKALNSIRNSHRKKHNYKPHHFVSKGERSHGVDDDDDDSSNGDDNKEGKSIPNPFLSKAPFAYRGVPFNRTISHYSTQELSSAVPNQLAIALKKGASIQKSVAHLIAQGYAIKGASSDQIVIEFPASSVMDLKTNWTKVDAMHFVRFVTPRIATSAQAAPPQNACPPGPNACVIT
jgi:hypothetical protein